MASCPWRTEIKIFHDHVQFYIYNNVCMSNNIVCENQTTFFTGYGLALVTLGSVLQFPVTSIILRDNK